MVGDQEGGAGVAAICNSSHILRRQSVLTSGGRLVRQLRRRHPAATAVVPTESPSDSSHSTEVTHSIVNPTAGDYQSKSSSETAPWCAALLARSSADAAFGGYPTAFHVLPLMRRAHNRGHERVRRSPSVEANRPSRNQRNEPSSAGPRCDPSKDWGHPTST